MMNTNELKVMSNSKLDKTSISHYTLEIYEKNVS